MPGEGDDFPTVIRSQYERQRFDLTGVKTKVGKHTEYVPSYPRGGVTAVKHAGCPKRARGGRAAVLCSHRTHCGPAFPEATSSVCSALDASDRHQECWLSFAEI